MQKDRERGRQGERKRKKEQNSQKCHVLVLPQCIHVSHKRISVRGRTKRTKCIATQKDPYSWRFPSPVMKIEIDKDQFSHIENLKAYSFTVVISNRHLSDYPFYYIVLLSSSTLRYIRSSVCSIFCANLLLERRNNVDFLKQ